MRITVPAALLIIIGIFSSAAVPGERSAESILLTLPQLKWVLMMGAPGFAVSEKEMTDVHTSARFFADNGATGMVLSGFLEKAEETGDAKACRAYYWEKGKKSPWKKDEVTMRESGEMAILEYMVKSVEGVELNQKNLNAFLCKDGYWIDIHLSKTPFEPEDESLFKEILDQVRIVEKSSLTGEKTIRRYSIPNHGILVVPVPESWNDIVDQAAPESPPTLHFTGGAEKDFLVLVTPLWSPGKNPEFNSEPSIKKIVQRSGEASLAQAEEKKLTLQPLGKKGYYFSLTDKKPKPGEWKYLNQGSIGVGDLLIAFTILTHSPDSNVIREALDMLTGAKLAAE